MARKKKQRSDDQTVTACSMSKALFQTMEEAREDLQMDRSNFIRYCIAKELKNMGMKVAERKAMYGDGRGRDPASPQGYAATREG